MTTKNSINYESFIDFEKGAIERRIFSDEQIYQTELENIFLRAWNFMCHESQIPKAGDFFQNFIGEEAVIVTRDKNGGINVLFNTCRHRGTAVCRAESGSAKSFMCPYHGWTYDMEGALIGVPGLKNFYHGELDRSKLGLIRAPKVTSYKGFVFANMDPDAPSLEDYLGPVGRMALDTVAARGDLVVFGGVLKNQINANWKAVVDNSHDWYHPDITHMSAMTTMFDVFNKDLPKEQDAPKRAPRSSMQHRIVMGEYGHAMSGPRLSDEAWSMIQEKHETLPRTNPFFDHGWRGFPDVIEQIGEIGATTAGFSNIFPNLFICSNGTQLSLRLPKGLGRTEVWWFSIYEKDMSPEQVSRRAVTLSALFGPAGLLEQDDGANWETSTAATTGLVARRYSFDVSMNIGRSKIQVAPNGAHYSDTHVNEHGQLWTWKSWSDWMNAKTWADLKANKTPVPHDTV